MRKLTWAGLTDVGMKRSGNEDAFVVDDELGLYVVCDGMGGHASGEVASAMVTEEVVLFMRDRFNGNADLPYDADEDATESERILSNSIQHANDKVYVAGMKDSKLEGMGTTVVAVLENPDGTLTVAHVGDSRIYRFRDGILEQVTRDHSLLNHKIDMGELKTEEDIKGFKHGNIIVRAIGLKDYVRPETAVIDRRPGDVLLLCSDGLTDLVDDWAIENVLDANFDELEEAATILVRMANDRGGKDNITVVLCRIDDDPEVDDVEYAHGGAYVEEVTQPGPDDVTDPGLKPFDEHARFRDFDAEEDDRTAPHTPVFMWDDLDDETSPEPRRTPTAKIPSVVVDDDDDEEKTVPGLAIGKPRSRD